MAAKVSGAEIYKFYVDGWPVHYYHDDCEFDVVDEQDQCLLDREKKYDLKEFGVLVHLDDQTKVISFSAAFNKWKKSSGLTMLTFWVPNELVEKANKAIGDLV